MSASGRERFVKEFSIRDYDHDRVKDFPDDDVHGVIYDVVVNYNNLIKTCAIYDPQSEASTQFYAKIHSTNEIFKMQKLLYTSLSSLQNMLLFDDSYQRSYQMGASGLIPVMFIAPCNKLADAHLPVLETLTSKLRAMLIHDSLEFTKLSASQRSHLYSSARREVMSPDTICYMYKNDVSTVMYMIYLRAMMCSTYVKDISMSLWTFNRDFKELAKLVTLFPTNLPIMSYTDAMLVKTVENLKLCWGSIPFSPLVGNLLDVLEISLARLVTRVCSREELTVACFRKELRWDTNKRDQYVHTDVFLVCLQTSLVSLRKMLFVIRKMPQKIVAVYQKIPLENIDRSVASQELLIKSLYPTKTQSLLFYTWIYDFARERALSAGISKDIYDLGMRHNLPPGTMEWCGRLVESSRYSYENFLEKIYSTGFTMVTKEFNQLPMTEYLASGSRMAITVCCFAILKHVWKSVFDSIKLSQFIFEDPVNTFRRHLFLDVSSDPKLVCASGEIGVYYNKNFFICPDALYALILWTNIIVFEQSCHLSSGVNVTKLLCEIYGKSLSERLFSAPIKPFCEFERILLEDQLTRNKAPVAKLKPGDISVVEI